MHKTAFAGERLDIRAADWNRVLGYVNRQTTGATPGSSNSQTVVYAKNTFGSAIPAGGVARIGLKSSKTIDKTKSLGDQFFELTAPTNTLASWDNLVIAIDPIPDGKMGRVCVEGLCWALVEAASEPATASDKPWLVPASVSSVWMFRRMWSGCARLVLPLASGDTSGSTSDLCPVILGNVQPVMRATLTSTWSSNLATCTVTDIRGGSFAASTTSNIHDPDGAFSDVANGSTITVTWIGGNRVLAGNAAC
jgi:hypothetical protein